MDTSPNLALPYIIAAQAQKHVTHNEAIRGLDALVHLMVLDKDLSTPPGSPSDGDRYIVAASPTGAWAGHAGKVAAWQDGAWAFYTPRAGWLAWVADETKLYSHDGSAWSVVTVSVGSGAALWGINASADTTNRLAVKSPASLFDNVGAGHQQKINKAAAGDTASQLFQTGYSGRAEFGLTGDDDWHVKVSPDGSTWFEALIADRSSGAVRFPSTPYLDLPAAGAPATPASGKVRLYAKTDKSLYQKDDAGTETGLAGGGGGGSAAPSMVGLHNAKLVESHAAGAATLAIKTLAGNDPSGVDAVTAVFPDGSTLAITAALSVTIPSGATMGFANGVADGIWVALANDAGTARLVVRNCRSGSSIVGFPADGLLSSSAIGTGSDNAQTNYSGAAVTDKPYVLVGRAAWSSGLATAGTWDAAPSAILQFGPGVARPGEIIQNAYAEYTASADLTTAFPYDDTIPQSTEGTQIAAITSGPMDALAHAVLEFRGNGSHGSAGVPLVCALFRDSGANALAARDATCVGGSFNATTSLEYQERPGAGSFTYKVRVGPNSGTMRLNGHNAGRIYGGAQRATLIMRVIQG